MASVDVQQQGGHATSFEPLIAVQDGQSKRAGKHDVETTLNYYLDDGQPPKPAYVGKPETYERPTYAQNVTVHDIRGEEDQFDLDNKGFLVYPHVSKEKDFLDDDKIKAEYYPEVEQLLKDATGATRVFIFDHTIRRQAQDNRSPSGGVLRGPVNRVHIDQSYKAAASRVPFHLPDEAERLSKHRFQIINVWRPIKTIYKDPLGIADSNSVPDDDLVVIPLIYPNRNGETYSVKPSDQHKWYYLHAQTPEEPLLIKCFDTKTDGRARRVPHTAFTNPEYEDGYSRESIEVRTLVFYEDQDAN